MREFWVSSGHHLTHRTEGGGLAVTDELLLAYLARPELIPPEEACEAERALHASLAVDPRRPVEPAEVAAISDADARENWSVMLALRQALLGAPTIEAAYLRLVRANPITTPVIFLNQLVHLILRNALDGCEDPYVLRAAELFFRPQRVSVSGETVLLADAELIDAQDPGARGSPLAAMLGREPIEELDILDDESAWTYWSRSDAFSMALNLSSNPKSREGLARAVEAWLRHLLHLETRVEPIATVQDRDWRWFIGLDAEATRIGNAVWRGESLSSDELSRLLAMFSLSFADRSRIDPRVAGHPAYLFLAMNPDRRLILKPQNLIVGLPLAAGQVAA
ncbi:DUF6352 family protein [Enterovirga aerilata]|uniref:Uncharacterized protein n=1 Tax=Enterovirga aerilata TaxID=2730920 RepID=A0A849IFA7_9HYPH|nr:hypothetical protein [Enterovirga sp. DB1703]